MWDSTAGKANHPGWALGGTGNWAKTAVRQSRGGIEGQVRQSGRRGMAPSPIRQRNLIRRAVEQTPSCLSRKKWKNFPSLRLVRADALLTPSLPFAGITFANMSCRECKAWSCAVRACLLRFNSKDRVRRTFGLDGPLAQRWIRSDGGITGKRTSGGIA